MKQKPARRPTHPGELLREDIIPATGMSEEEFARRLELPAGELAAILDASAPITEEVAMRLGRLFGKGPAIWTGMQDAWDRFPESIHLRR
ncbi:MAG: HigA family addiction module antidote protein [Tabrizicola sp.]|nr:HigA family addiction module antidote protein [Tabrizicola sp.]